MTWDKSNALIKKQCYNIHIDRGLRYLKITFEPQQILFHGTLDIYCKLIEQNGIKIIKRVNNGVDFGPGFYLTSGKEEQAVNWARDRTANPRPIPELLGMLNISVRDFINFKNSFKPVVMKYRIKEINRFLELKHEVFEQDSLRWREFVWTWRQANYPPEYYDWVFGPVADGNISSPSYSLIRAFEGMNQLSIHNEETAQLLELLEVKTC